MASKAAAKRIIIPKTVKRKELFYIPITNKYKPTTRVITNCFAAIDKAAAIAIMIPKTPTKIEFYTATTNKYKPTTIQGTTFLGKIN